MDWQTIRNKFMRQTGGDLPGNQLEQNLIDAYREHPEAVERSIEKITLAFQAGKIRSPWGALKTEVAKAVDTARNPTHEAGATKTKAVQRAEQRIRNELLHYDREDEALDELFGPRGTLRQHDTPELRQRTLDHWNNLRPLGELAEHEAVQRGLRYQEQRPTIRPLADKLPKPGNLEVSDGIPTT